MRTLAGFWEQTATFHEETNLSIRPTLAFLGLALASPVSLSANPFFPTNCISRSNLRNRKYLMFKF